MSFVVANPQIQHHPNLEFLPVASLADLLATGRVHAEVAPVLQAAASVEVKKSPEYARHVANREPLRAALEGLMDEHRVDALAYPTIRRTAAPLGEEQLGNNAHASANSGLPAISLPAGFSEDGLPVGLDLLGRRFDDTKLVSIAHAIERKRPIRRAPAATPEL